MGDFVTWLVPSPNYEYVPIYIYRTSHKLLSLIFYCLSVIRVWIHIQRDPEVWSSVNVFRLQIMAHTCSLNCNSSFLVYEYDIWLEPDIHYHQIWINPTRGQLSFCRRILMTCNNQWEMDLCKSQLVRWLSDNSTTQLVYNWQTDKKNDVTKSWTYWKHYDTISLKRRICILCAKCCRTAPLIVVRTWRQTEYINIY